MDTTLLSIFFVLGVVVAWIASYAIKVNRESKSTKKTSGVKDELFGKKKRGKKASRGQFWALE
jgi:hypothetical protein